MTDQQPPPLELPERPHAFDLASYPCPRCGAVMSADDYQMCDACVQHLQVTVVRSSGETAEAAAYEPKMNVTPNAVALKDD